MGQYFDELQRTRTYLGEQPDTLFLGQAVAYKGTAMTNTLQDVSKDKLIEMPVDEEMQMGITIGLAMNGHIPVSIYPRFNFLLLAMNQLINHLDKYKIMHNDRSQIKTIIRTSIGSEKPLHPQYQHIGDFTESIEKMSSTIDIIKLDDPEKIFSLYKKALNRKDGKSSILVEFGDYYNEK